MVIDELGAEYNINYRNERPTDDIIERINDKQKTLYSRILLP